MRRILTLILLMAALGACEHGGDEIVGGDDDNGGGNGSQLEPTLTSIQSNIFNTSCAVANCHVTPGAAGLNLSAGSARAELVNVPATSDSDFLRVDPGNSGDSYLVMKLEGDDRIVGSRMPMGRPALSSTQIGMVRQWIDDGAQ